MNTAEIKDQEAARLVRRKARRAAMMAKAVIANAKRRALRRAPSPHTVTIAEMKRACLLPAPGADISEDDRRKVRNKLKAMRRARG